MKKKIYNQPRVETMQLMPSTVVLAGSPGKGIGAGTGGGTTGNIGSGSETTPIPGE
jgi:hypothetical protein